MFAVERSIAHLARRSHGSRPQSAVTKDAAAKWNLFTCAGTYLARQLQWLDVAVGAGLAVPSTEPNRRRQHVGTLACSMHVHLDVALLTTSRSLTWQQIAKLHCSR